MADNYLEKKLEEHRSRMAAGVPRQRRRTPVVLPLTFPERHVLVIAPGNALQGEVVKALRAAGHRVAFIDPAGRSLAQATGARCYPFSPDRIDEVIDDIKRHWGGLDITVTASPSGGFLVEDLTDGALASVDGRDGVDTASAVVIFTHPSSRLIHRCKAFDRE